MSIGTSEPVLAAPQEVKRYEFIPVGEGGIRAVEDSDGDYVLHSAYVSLREELQKAQSELNAVDSALARRPMTDGLNRSDAIYKACSHAQKNLDRAIKAESQVADMRKALQNILSRFPSDEDIHDLAADGGMPRPCPMQGRSYFTDKEILAFRKLLSEVKP